MWSDINTWVSVSWTSSVYKRKIESWQSLARVCRRCKGLVFGSTRHLHLQRFCIPRISARKSLNVWPALPLLIQGGVSETSVVDAIAVLEHSDRICQIDLECDTTLQIEKLRTAMQEPCTSHVTTDTRTSWFVLGWICTASATPCLDFHSISGSTEVAFVCHPPHPFSPTRSVLPILLISLVKAWNGYLEEFVARIDTPQLYWLSTMFYDDIHFGTPELNRFISRTPTLGAYN